MDDKRKRMVLTILGALLVILAITADLIGIGQVPGFGYKQMLVLIIGVLVLFAGIKPCKCSK